MNSIDTENDKDVDEIKEDAKENEEINKSFDLEKEKQLQNRNEFNAEGNMAGMQVFIQNVGSIRMPHNIKIEETDYNHPSKSFNLCDANECSEFVEKYKNSEYLVIAIILSTFESVALGDLPDLQNNLIPYLPMPKIKDGEETNKYYSRQDSYLPLNKILGVIGGKRFITNDGKTCAWLGQNSNQALVNILEQFPLLREPIVTWLIHMNEIYSYKTSFEAYQIVAAFARVISFDFIDAKRRIFFKLYSNSQNAGLLGNLAYKLYKDNILREEVENIILQWIKSDSIWLWKAACLTYSLFMENNIAVSFAPYLSEAVSKRILLFNKDDFFFISSLLIQSKHLRTMIADIFYIAYHKAVSSEKKVIVAHTYIDLVRHCYYRVNAIYTELPLVACDSKQQQKQIAQIVAQIMSTYRLRKYLYIILETYLKELSDYEFSADLTNHISAFFCNMISDDTAYQEDVLYFLRNCKSKAAAQIYKKLHNIYTRGELELHE